MLFNVKENPWKDFYDLWYVYSRLKVICLKEVIYEHICGGTFISDYNNVNVGIKVL